jgi:hypothetical protein
MTICVCVCVYVRYRTNLNVVGMGSKLLGVLGRTLRWSSDGQKFKKLILKKLFFFTRNAKEAGKQTETGNSNGGGNVGGNGKRLIGRFDHPPTQFFCTVRSVLTFCKHHLISHYIGPLRAVFVWKYEG